MMSDHDISYGPTLFFRAALTLLLSLALTLGVTPSAFAVPDGSNETSDGSSNISESTSGEGTEQNGQGNSSDANVEKTVRIGYYYGDPAFQDGFSDDERKSGYAYVYYQQLAPYAAWNYDYVYLSRSEAIEALENGEVDIVAGVYKTPKLEEELLFSETDMGLDGEPRYFAVNKNRPDLLEELNAANDALLENDPRFQLQNWQEYYDKSDVVTTLSKTQQAWLDQKGLLRLGYLTTNLPISGQDENGDAAGALGAVVPILESFLGIPIETVAFTNHVAMNDAILNGEVDVIFPVYSDEWTSES